MKILLGSHHFPPSTGGIETVSELLAREFHLLGHDVRVITQTEGPGTFPFPVIRRPRMRELLRQVRWCEVFLQNNISLRTIWPLLFIRRALWIAHQTWITQADGHIGWTERGKRFVLRFARSVAISEAIAQQLPVSSIKIGNPYDDETFRDFESGPRETELIFVGRLVSDKGVDLLLEALSRLSSNARLTIAGDGPERGRLEKQVADLKLQAQVEFVGKRNSRELAVLLNQHRILVVPSRWAEPFGVVALEGIACGCVVVGSSAGGLAEAIGPCGMTFPNNDVRALATVLDDLLRDPARCDSFRRGAQAHLARFTRRHVAGAYLAAMSGARS